MLKFVILVQLYLLSSVSVALCSSFQTSSQIVDIALQNGVVYLGGEKKLYVLTADLVLNQTIELASDSASVLKLSLDGNGSRAVVCMSDGSCVTYSSAQLGRSELDRIEAATVPARPMALVYVPTENGDSFYVGSEGRSTSIDSSNIIVLGGYAFENRNIYRTSDRDFTISSESFTKRDFIGAFYGGSYVYFIVLDKGTGTQDNAVRVLRICNDTNSSIFGSMYEAQLDCGVANTGSLGVSGMSVITNSAGDATDVVVAISNLGENQVCSFALAAINSEMSHTFKDCADGDMRIPLIWADDEYIDDCTSFTEEEATECNFGFENNNFIFIPALGTFRSVAGTSVVNYADTIDEMTAVLSMYIDSVLHLYVAFTNGTNKHFVNSYHVDSESDTTVILSSVEFSTPVRILHWDPQQESLYAVSDYMITKMSVESCSSYRLCSECTADSSLLCGWCTLENKCSRRSHCSHSNLKGRWLQSHHTCISGITLSPPIIVADNLRSVELQILPASFGALEIKGVENFTCNFYNESHGYFFTTPLLNTTCSIQSFGVPTVTGNQLQLSLDFTLTAVDGLAIYESQSALSMINCSVIKSCLDCVDVRACGWCILTHSCTGLASTCGNQSSYLISKEEGDVLQQDNVCPELLIPSTGYYLQPVSVTRGIQLQTRNLPIPIPGSRYQCDLKYSDGTLLSYPSFYYSINNTDKTILCQVSSSKPIELSSATLGGTELVHISLVWVNDSGHQQFEFTISANVLLYSCSEIAQGCSSCLSISDDDAGYDCGWCYRRSDIATCSVSEECIEGGLFNSTFATTSRDCPAPRIVNLFPASGPTAGGTWVVIRGTDLGLHVRNIISVTFGTSPCTLYRNAYVPGSEIVCNTSESSIVGEVSVIVVIQRDFSIVNAYSTFVYAIPSIVAVSPTFGPVSGGTIVTITGMSLNISDTSAIMVKLVGVNCSVQSVTENKICCISQPAHESSGLVQVVIDAASLFGEGIFFHYKRDPLFLSVHPQNTIPAGGMTLIFEGLNLDAVQQPQMSITVQGRTVYSLCSPINMTHLRCVTPRLTEISHDAVQQSYEQPLEYAIKMDGVMGPSFSDEDFQIILKPDPVFLMIQETYNHSCQSGNEGITIMGKNLDSIPQEDIKVTIGSQSCKIFALTEMRLSCCIPEDYVKLNQTVEVTVGNGSLQFNVGSLYYPSSDDANGGSLRLAISLSVATCVFLIAVISTITFVVIFYKMKKPQREITANESESIKTGQLNTYDMDNIYETISDCFTAMDTEQHTSSSVYTMNDRSSITSDSSKNNDENQPQIPISPSGNSDYTDMRAQLSHMDTATEDLDGSEYDIHELDEAQCACLSTTTSLYIEMQSTDVPTVMKPSMDYEEEVRYVCSPDSALELSGAMDQ